MNSPELVLLLPIGILVGAVALRAVITLLFNKWRDRQFKRAVSRRFNDRDDDPPLAI